MKFNTSYQELINFEKTIKEISHIKNFMINNMKIKYKLFNVSPPIVAEEGDDINLDFRIKTRDVSFESSENRILKLFLSYANWEREILKRLDLKDNEGIYFEANTLWRDLIEDAVSTITKQELIFAFKVSKNIDRKIENLTFIFYKLIYKLAQRIEKNYKIKNIWPENPIFITSQQLENEMPNLSFKERENEFILNEHTFFLKNAGTTLFSGKRHTCIPIQSYDLKNFNQIFMFERNNSSALQVVSIGALISGEKLSNQLIAYRHSEMTTLPFYKNNIKENKKFIEIKINIANLAMVLLAKGHIGEVQAGVISDEAENIKSWYNVDIY